MQMISESTVALLWFGLGLFTLTNAQYTSLKRDGYGIDDEMRKLRTEIEELKGQIHDLTQSSDGNGRPIPQAAGAVYTRWGRTTCPDSASLVYPGYAAGSWFSHTGGMSELVCLPRDPEWGRYVSGLQAQSYIYGTEYQTHAYGGNQLLLTTNANVESVHNHDVPCAVCFTSDKGVAEMVPAKQSCPEGWTVQYHGYLMSQHINWASQMKAVCVDEAPEVLESGSANQNGALLYHVEVVCGSLPCPPYVNGRELTCTVCSR